jgi:chitodextrinase
MKISKQSRKPLRLVSLAAILLLVVGFVAATANITPTQAASWNLQWSDEFNGAAGTGVNPSNWFYDTGQGVFGTGEIENMTNSTSNVYQDGNGHLVLKAINNGGQWTSGRVESQLSNFAAPAGGILAVEASIQQPNLSGAAAAGYWPAFWMLGSTLRTGGSWPSVGEIDIMEDINGRSSVFGTMHCGTAPGGPCNENNGIGSGERACPGCQTAFHTYRMEYDKSVSPEQIRWYLDGVNYFTINSTQVDATTWANATNHAFFVILDLAMGGGFPAAFGGGPTSSTVSGGTMVVDYVRVYTMGGTAPTTTVATTTPVVTTTKPATGCTAPTYSSTAVYTGGMQVSYNGHTWQAKWWTQGEAPSTGGSGVWTDLGPCSGGTTTTTAPPTTTVTAPPTTTPVSTTPSGIPAWTPNVSYHIGDLVTYQGKTYKCIQAHTSQVGWEPPNVPALWQAQ